MIRALAYSSNESIVNWTSQFAFGEEVLCSLGVNLSLIIIARFLWTRAIFL